MKTNLQGLEERYEIVEDLGAGQQGHLYRARERRPPFREVALKSIPLREGTSLLTLQKEFEILAKLSHPNIVTVYNFGIDAQQSAAFIAEEFLEGERSRHAQVPEKVLVNRLVSLSHALQYLHQHHLYHRDIKPENIVILPSEEPKLVDFGLACESTGERQGGLSGTINYLSPERLGEGPPSAASDLYALGVTLYEWATGRLPFQRDSMADLMTAILWDLPISPSRENPDLSPALAELILMLLQKNPLDRPRQANDLIREMNRRMNGNFPLEKGQISETLRQVAGRVGREDLLREVLVHAGQEGPSWIVVEGEPGTGKSPFLSVLSSQLELAGLEPKRFNGKEPDRVPSDLLSAELPGTLLIDDFDLLAPPLQLKWIEQARRLQQGIWVWTCSIPNDYRRTFQGKGRFYTLGGLEIDQVKQFLLAGLNLESIDDSFVMRLHRFTGGRPRAIIQSLALLLDEALDPLEPLAPQLARIDPEEYLEGDPLTGIRAKKSQPFKEYRARLISQTKERLLQEPENLSDRRLLARLLYENGDYQEVFKVIQFNHDPRFYINACNRLGRFEETLLLCRRGKEGQGTFSERASLLNQEGTALFFLGRREEATRLLKGLVEQAREKGAWKVMIPCLNNLANVISHGERPLEAVPLYQESLRLARERSDSLGEARGLANLGHIYHVIQDYIHALEGYLAGANRYRRAGFLGEMAQIKGNLGQLYLELGAWSQAEESILESLRLALEREMAYQVHAAHLAYGALLRRRGRFQEAAVYYEKAERGFAVMKMQKELHQIQLGRIRLNLSQGLWKEAALLLKELGSPSLAPPIKAEAKFLEAGFFLERGEALEKIEPPAREALAIYRRLNQPDNQFLSLTLLKKGYDWFNKLDQAQQCQKEMEILLKEARRRVPPEYWDTYLGLVPI